MGLAAGSTSGVQRMPQIKVALCPCALVVGIVGHRGNPAPCVYRASGRVCSRGVLEMLTV